MNRRMHLAALLGILGTQAAWDTFTLSSGKDGWQSMYVIPPNALPPGDAHYMPLSNGFVDLAAGVLTGNEHAEISHMALLSLGWGSLYDEMPTIVDLNESIYRRELLRIPVLPELFEIYGDVEEEGLTVRALPHVARFSGTPDFSYSIADWLNKNRYCPALPEGAPSYDQCHGYEQWLGAALNSSHFGDQATASYKHFHRVARGLASHAGEMGALLDSVAAENREELEAYVREAEFEALAYEAHAQHFLQDRWSSGHMWNRWNSPTYEGFDRVPTTDSDLAVHRLIGAITGTIHGAEAVLKSAGGVPAWVTGSKVADPMCSPLVVGEVAIPVAHADSTCVAETTESPACIQPGVGDYRLADMVRGEFGIEYYGVDMPLDTGAQLVEMLACAHAGWADIASEFHLGAQGGYGTLGLPVGPAVPRFSGTDFDVAELNGFTVDCWDQWATNRSMVQGQLLKLILSNASLGELVFMLGGRAARLLENVDGRDLVRLRQQMVLAERLDPFGTTLARTWQSTTPRAAGDNNLGLISFQGAAPGGEYVDQIPAQHHEPVDLRPLESLPVHSDAYGRRWGDSAEVDDPTARPGLDKHTIFGFFNQAHADYWCEEAESTLEWNDDLPLWLEDGRPHPRQGLRMPVPRPDDATDQAELEVRLDACILLADRLYEGTSAFYLPAGQREYTGESAEQRTVDHGDGSQPPARAPCDVFEPTGTVDWFDAPKNLHPGYVIAADPEDRISGAYLSAEQYDHPYYLSVENWCRALPVVNVNSEDMAVDGAGDGIVVTPGFLEDGRMAFVPEVLEPVVTIHGFNFGDQEGRVRLDGDSGCIDPVTITPLADIVSWSDTAISFTVPGERFVPDIYRITIIRDDRDEDGQRVRSVGRSRLDIRRAAYTGISSPGAPLPVDSTSRSDRVIHPYCAGGQVLRHEIWDCSGLSSEQQLGCGDDTVGAGASLWTIQSGPADPQPGPWDEHQWSVAQAGNCDVLGFPEPCPDGLPVFHGLVYDLERVSEQPIEAQSVEWRFTLAWERPGV